MSYLTTPTSNGATSDPRRRQLGRPRMASRFVFFLISADCLFLRRNGDIVWMLLVVLFQLRERERKRERERERESQPKNYDMNEFFI